MVVGVAAVIPGIRNERDVQCSVDQTCSPCGVRCLPVEAADAVGTASLNESGDVLQVLYLIIYCETQSFGVAISKRFGAMALLLGGRYRGVWRLASTPAPWPWRAPQPTKKVRMTRPSCCFSEFVETTGFTVLACNVVATPTAAETAPSTVGIIRVSGHVARNTIWTLGWEARIGFISGSINIKDGQRSTARQSPDAMSARQFDGATTCMAPGRMIGVNPATASTSVACV